LPPLPCCWSSDEISEKILSFLDSKTLCQVEQVSHDWLRIVRMGSHMLWRKRYLEQTSLDPRWGSLQHCHHTPPDLSNLSIDAPPPSYGALSQQALPLADWKQRYKEMTMGAHNLTENWKNGRYEKKVKATASNGIYCLQFDEEKILTGSRDHRLKVWGLRGLDMQNEFVRAAAVAARPLRPPP